MESWGGGGEPRGARLTSRGGFSVVIAEPHSDSDDKAWEEGRSGTRPTIHLSTNSIDDRYKEVPQGEHIVIKPEKTHWGTKWFVVRDPDGNMIAFNEDLHG